jgi:hypothetical protein
MLAGGMKSAPAVRRQFLASMRKIPFLVCVHNLQSDLMTFRAKARVASRCGHDGPRLMAV